MGAPPPPGWPPHRGKSRKPLWVTLAAGGAVLVVVGIVLAITLSGGGGHGRGGSAGDVVKGYLEALSRGDAEEALTYSSDQPASKELLTTDILKKQIAQWPITNVRILSDDSTGSGATIGFGQVHVAANFGEKTSDTTISMKKEQGKWVLPTAAVKIQQFSSAANDAASKTLTFFGKPLGTGTTYVFPGWIDIGSTNPYLKVTNKPLLLDALSAYGESYLQPEITVSDKGRDATHDQLSAAMANCTKSNLLAPPGCPLSVSPAGLADGTATWGPVDISGIKFDYFDPTRLVWNFSGHVAAPFSAKRTNGSPATLDPDVFVSGEADMAKTPPALSFH